MGFGRRVVDQAPISDARAVVFDMDGLLLDSEPFWQRAEQRVFRQLGLILTTEMCSQTIGLRVDEVVEHWSRRLSWSQTLNTTQIAQDILDEMVVLFHSQAQLMPGVEEALAYYATKGLPLGIASSSPLVLINAFVNRFSLESVFDSVCSAEFEVYGKPHPAVYIRCCEQLGVKPAASLAFEDSLNGVLSAKSAKMAVIAIPSAKEYERSEFAIADAKYRCLHDFIARLEVDVDV